MALQRYQTLAAMVALGEFTIKDLAERAGVVETSVRTIVGRIIRKSGDAYIERVGTVPSGRRGGSYHLYRLSAEGEQSLLTELRRIEATVSELSRVSQTDLGHTERADAFLVAERILLHQLPTETHAPEWRELLNLASSMIEGADGPRRSSDSERGHSAATRFLLHLAEGEDSFRKMQQAILNRLASVTGTLEQDGFDSLSQQISDRVRHSVFGSRTVSLVRSDRLETAGQGASTSAQTSATFADYRPSAFIRYRTKRLAGSERLGQPDRPLDASGLSLVHPVKFASRIDILEAHIDLPSARGGKYLLDERLRLAFEAS
jgi:hypothetical protein